jgi:sulfur carrier protein ThiS
MPPGDWWHPIKHDTIRSGKPHHARRIRERAADGPAGGNRRPPRDTVAVSISFFPLLAKRSRSRQERLTAEYHDGLRPKDILESEGFNETDMDAIMVVVNDAQAELDAPVRDGDRLEFMIAISGG